MKKKGSLILPFVALFSIVMLVCAFVSLAFSKVMFAVELILAIAGIIASIVIYISYATYLRTTVKGVVVKTRGIDKKYLDRFAFPVATVGSDREFIWYNTAFERIFCKDAQVHGMPVSSIISGRSVEEFCSSVGGNIEFGDSKYTVYANPLDRGFVLYFFDDTRLKNIEREYFETRQSVALVVLDNDDAFKDDDEDELTRVVVEVESTLNKWATENNGLYRKLGAGRYMVLFEERDLKKIIENKFEILSKIREISSGDTGATISIGIGRGESSLRKSQATAKRALDMALGRGGDQVAILSAGEFQFFGGKSVGVEHHSKVRVRVIAKTIVDAIDDCDKVLIMGHKFSDLDCMGSAIGLRGGIVTSFAKDTYIVVDYETSMAKSLIDNYKVQCKDGVFITEKEALPLITEKTLLIIVDTQSESRIESKAVLDACEQVIVIDHHRMSVDHLNNTLVFYHEPNASSASEMCVELLDNLPDVNLKKPEAEALLSGIILDTKNFVINSGARTFEAAAYLKKRGADTVAVRQLFADSIEIYRNKYLLVSTAKIYKRCAIVLAEENMKDIRLIASKAADELLGLKGVNASFVVFRSDDRTVNVSARSFGKRNVQIIMERLGGGGHHSMAAAQLRDVTFETAMRKLVEAIDSETE